MTDRAAPRCPWCWADMEKDPHSAFKDRRQLEYWYWCERCGAQSPRKSETDYDTGDEARDAAYAAAMQRYVEPNRVLTLGDVMQLHPDGATCVEERRTGAIEVLLNCEIIEEFEIAAHDIGRDAVQKLYGRFSRAWLRRPTDEEREAAKWTE